MSGNLLLGGAFLVITLEAKLADAAAREEGGARGGREACAAEERHGVRRGRHAGAPAHSYRLTAKALLGLTFCPLSLCGVVWCGVRCYGVWTKVERLLCTYCWCRPCPAVLSP